MPAAFYYNFGTASLRAGKAGPATVYLLKALADAPFDRDTNYNLGMAQSALSPNARATRPASWLSWWPTAWHFLPFEIFCIPFLISLGILFWSVAGAKVKKNLPVLATVTLLFLGFSGLGYLQTQATAAGVVNSAKVKSGPGSSFPEITALEAGSTVDVEEFREGWTKIRFSTATSAELVGWIEPGAILRFR
jgi:hypothetical protein